MYLVIVSVWVGAFPVLTSVGFLLLLTDIFLFMHVFPAMSAAEMGFSHYYW